jgi:hypothetical protein
MTTLAEQEAIIEAVTGNGSHPEASAVIRNACERCEKGWEREKEWHCRTCHSDKHGACSWCKTCMPDRHRRDRRYCSATCRVRALEWRRSPEGREDERQYQAWLQSDEVKAWHGALGDLAEALGEASDAKEIGGRLRRALRTGETCAICECDLGDGPVYWRPVYNGLTTTLSESDDQVRAAPVCAGCFCDHRVWGGIIRGHQRQAWLCERCRPHWRGKWTWDPLFGSSYQRGWRCPEAGEHHRNLYCEQCHPAQWKAVQCSGCERAVMLRPHGNRSYDYAAYDDEDADVPERWPRAFCSQRCRSRVDHDKAATRRIQARQEHGPHQCGGCGEVLDGRRADARYCSGACRQRAYRQQGGAS